MRLRRTDKAVFYAQLESVLVDGEEGAGNVIRTVVIDMTVRKQAEDTLRRYTRRLIELDEDIRKKLAAELHDEIGQSLTALGINFAMLTEELPDQLRKKLGSRIKYMGGLVEGASGIVRRIMADLRPPVLNDYGLSAALRWHGDLFSKRTGIAVNIRSADTFPRLPPEKEAALYRIAQEALVNIAKHAAASIAKLKLASSEGKIRLSISDNGKGFDPPAGATARARSGWGLTIMGERARSLGGTFYVESSPGKGTRVLIEIPED